jgi:hypothetical protein
MWDRDSAWFDLSIVLGTFAIGGVLFGRFEQHRPRWRRALKVILVSALFVWTAQAMGRFWAYTLLGAMAAAALVIHAWWLPRHGISGWTAEPYERYLDLVSKRRRRNDAS